MVDVGPVLVAERGERGVRRRQGVGVQPRAEHAAVPEVAVEVVAEHARREHQREPRQRREDEDPAERERALRDQQPAIGKEREGQREGDAARHRPSSRESRGEDEGGGREPGREECPACRGLAHWISKRTTVSRLVGVSVRL